MKEGGVGGWGGGRGKKSELVKKKGGRGEGGKKQVIICENLNKKESLKKKKGKKHDWVMKLEEGRETLIKGKKNMIVGRISHQGHINIPSWVITCLLVIRFGLQEFAGLEFNYRFVSYVT